MHSTSPLLLINDLRLRFPIKRNLIETIKRTPQRYVSAVDGVSLYINEGETLGLVGESGCGKSTLAKTLVQLYKAESGTIHFDGQDLTQLSGKELSQARRKIQMVFQDPYSSLNPRMSVRSTLREVYKVHKYCPPEEIDKRIDELLSTVGLGAEAAEKYPGEFSGGQRQRVGIARALALEPKLLIADEAVSALDVSIQAQIINLLTELQQKLNLTMLFITHDLGVVRCVSDRVAVMYLGQIVETAPAEELFEHPCHPYTSSLIAASPEPDPDKKLNTKAPVGEPPSPMDLPKGCRFASRCQQAQEKCLHELPKLWESSPGHFTACHYPI